MDPVHRTSVPRPIVRCGPAETSSTRRKVVDTMTRDRETGNTPVRRTLTGLAGCALACSTAGFGTATAQEDDAPVEPGEVVDVSPSEFQPAPGVATPTRAWRIEYRSTAATGDAATVPATVIVPLDGHSGTRPLASYAAGT